MLLPGMGLVYLLYLLLLVGAVCGGVRDKEGKKNKQLDYTRRLFDVARTRGYVSVPEREQEFVKGKICIGTNGRWSVPSNREHHYRNLKNRYTNCTYVDGNLELTWLQDQNFDLSFLQYIREVTGYVLISHVDLRRVVLPHLQIIRGRTLFKMTNYNEEFAIIVTTSKMYSLELPALRDVLSGSVGLFSNYNLCHVKTINWDEIISDPKGRYVYRYNFISPERECPPCHKNCEHGCWGEGEENCQKFSKVTCSPQCYQGRCFGSNPRECCHLFCAGGCTGPKQSDCIACKNFYDDGVCTQECPPMQIYNPITYSWEPNPHGKYAYGATCVKNCPEHLLKDNGACVKSCPLNKKAVNGECIPCNGPCPKTCRGDVAINAANIDDFKDCTVIEGFIHILENSFTGYQQVYPNSTFGVRYPPMHPSRLEVFSTLKEITGFLNIQAYHSDFKNLSYFRNLEIIGGRTFHDYFSSLYIVKTSLESLELKSLKRISSGTVAILENKHLCFADGIKWRKIIKSTEHMAFLQNNKDPKKCVADGLVCDQQCSNDGCWGPGPEECLSCAHFSLGNTCLQNCTVLPRIYKADDAVCQYCHEQCGSSCTGPGPEHCATCKHFRDGPYCVSKCPITKYENDGECKLCHSNCVDGCTGPTNTVGPGACNSCDKAVMNENATVDSCLHKNESCPSGYFFEWVRPQEQEFLKTLSGKAICRKCHPRCRKCTGYGFHELVCQECTSYKKGEQCEDECPSDYYADDTTQNCLPCHQECRGCKGPGPENCLACYNFKVYPDGIPIQNGSFTCMPNCPPEYPHKEYPEDNSDAYCSEIILGALEANLTTTMVITIATLVAVVIIVIIVWLVFYYRNEMKVKENAIKMSIALTGLEDNEPLRPTNALPNLAKLRIIKEEEMRRGGILGFGAFGTVYKGVWIPEGETSKIPVAIKILRDDTGTNRSKEFLEEAYIMATVNHPNLLELLAVCMTSPMMLVTQLMPLGCSLDFVRKNRNLIGSKLLLNWCTQIARGMAYLEEKRLVHRDLAARNVLLQNRETIRITDFGLAKLLDINEDEYKADGGKMPIKWLALECIQHRIFTHKSDVWAFGVTIWELLTFGGKPYENVPARNVPELLEKGERLPQPIICTIDVYMIMIKCWMLDAESRPSFTELEEDFTKMSRDPGRFLVIPGDRYLKTFQNQDEKDIRHLGCSLEHSSSQSEGDECMQPKSRAPISFSGLGSFFNSPQSARIKFWPSQSVVTSDGSCAPQNQHNWNQERLRYAQRHGLNSRMVSLGTAESDCSSIKCSSDGKNNDIDEYDSGRSEAQVGTLKLQLPVDEDDYLMPSPQQTQGPSTYVDLIEESVRHSDNSGSDSAEFCKTNIDNPEYLLNNDSPTQVVGIPTVSQVVQSNGGSASCDVVISVQQPQLLRPPSYMPQKSSEEESDHEYYNDFDRLKRELQPLQHRSETTV